MAFASDLSDVFFRGIALANINDKYVIKLCPGGGYMNFTLEEINQYMEEAIKTLVNLRLVPDYMSISIERHPGNTINNFIIWLNSNSNIIYCE